MDWAPVVDHAAIYKQAVQQKIALVVFINTPPKQIPNTLSYWTADFFGRKEAQVLVGYPKGNTLYELPMKVGSTEQDIQKQIDKVMRAARGDLAIGNRVFTLRAADGHTHTCSQKHTWDHKLTKSHNCPYCGEYVAIVDSDKKLVTVEVPTTTSPQVRAAPTDIFQFVRKVNRADCPNGNCPYVR